MSKEDEYTKAARAFGEAAEQCADAIGFGNWTSAWTCEEGSLSPVFGVGLGASGDIVYTVVVGYPCKPSDSMERMVDGLTVRECLERFTAMQQEPVNYTRVVDGEVYKSPPPRFDPLTPAQKDAARLAWSAELKRKQQEAGEKERRSVCVDDDRWEP